MLWMFICNSASNSNLALLVLMYGLDGPLLQRAGRECHRIPCDGRELGLTQSSSVRCVPCDWCYSVNSNSRVQWLLDGGSTGDSVFQECRGGIP